MRLFLASGVVVGCSGSPPDHVSAAQVDCAVDKCVALTVDDGPTRYNDRMEIGNHTWEHPNMTGIPPGFVDSQPGKAKDSDAAATRYMLMPQARPGSVVLGRDIPADRIPPLPATPSPSRMPNFPITDIPGADGSVPNNGP